MTLLFIQEWDVVPGKEEEYTAFVTDTFIPQSNALGLRAVGGFYVEVGMGPRTISLKNTESLDELYKIIVKEAFKGLTLGLKELVTNYGNRILLPTGRVNSKNYKIQKGVWKLIQYYNKRHGKREEYAEFIVNEYLPMLREIDYVEVTGGWDVVLGGSCEIVNELTFKSPIDIGRFLDNPAFRERTEKMRNDLVYGYNTRIIRTTERFIEQKWYRL